MTLDRLLEILSTTIRGGRPNEPSFEITDGYLKLQFAYGYQRLGNTARAAELEAAGHAQLAAYRADPVHAWLIDAFAARIRDQRPAELQERLEAFDRVTRFKVDMFREASWIIGGGAVDAAGQFGRMGNPAPDLAASTASFLGRVDRGFALAEEHPELADAYLETSLQVDASSIDPAAGASVLERVLPRVERMSERRGLAYARAIALAVHAAPARLAGLIEAIGPFIEADSWELDGIMALLSEALAHHRRELAAIWSQLPADVHDRPAYLIGQLRHGVMPNKHVVLRAVASSDVTAQKLRVVLLDTLLASPDSIEPWAAELFGTATDELKTNSHFSYSTVYVVDRLVRGVLRLIV